MKIIEALNYFIPLWKSKIAAVMSVLFKRGKKTVFLFGCPNHSNMGDQTQTLCIISWIKQNYPGFKVITFRLPEVTNGLLSLIVRTICQDDKIVCHSGYHMTDLYHEQDVYCKLVQLFPERPIWIFPQTINFKEEANLKKTAGIMNNHGHVTLMARDEISYATAQKYFTGCKLLLYPDIVTSLIGTKLFSNKREGVLFCVRNDIEAFYKKEDIQGLEKRFDGIHTEETDTTLKMPFREIIRNRERVLNQVLDYYSHFKIIITDRYHGTIFSLIAGTPVVVLKTSDHKLSSGVKWFPEEFKDYVTFANNLDEAYEKAVAMMGKELTHQLPPYFKENYYDKLKAVLEDGRD